MAQEEKQLTLDLHAGEFEAFLYSPSDEFLGIIRNEVTLLAFQCKICEASKEGYYLIYNGKKYNIDKTGRIMGNFPINYIDNYISFIVGF